MLNSSENQKSALVEQAAGLAAALRGDDDVTGDKVGQWNRAKRDLVMVDVAEVIVVRILVNHPTRIRLDNYIRLGSEADWDRDATFGRSVRLAAAQCDLVIEHTNDDVVGPRRVVD